MVRSVISLGVVTALLISGSPWLAPPAAAQTILKRLEQEIRQRVAEDRAAEAPPERNPGYLGALVDDRQDRGRGVRVIDVRPDGPAAAAGLREGDLITAIAGVRVRQTEDLADMMAVFPPGSRAAFDVLREGQGVRIDVRFGQRDSPSETPLSPPEAVPLPLPEPVSDPLEPAGQAGSSARPPAAPPVLSPAQPPTLGPAPPPEDRSEARAVEPPAELAELARLQARIAELERRVEQLEQALAEALTNNGTGPVSER